MMMYSESETPTGNTNPAFQDDAGKEASSTNGNITADKDGFQNVAFTATSDDVFVQTLPEKVAPDKMEYSGSDKRFLYGWGGFKPKFLQKTNRVGVFVFWGVILCLMEGFAVNGIGNAALPHIEKQFGLPSSKSALITSSQDIGALIVVLLVSFVGARYNKASWVAGGSVIMACGSLLFMVPHMASDAPILSSGGSSASGICEVGDNSTSGSGPPPGGNTLGLSHYLGVFMVAQMIHGVGFTPMFSLGTVYIEENEGSNTAAIYVGMTYAAAAVGVACGFFLGGQFTEKLFVDFDRLDQESLGFGPRDPRWIGAWWVGFIIPVVVLLIIALPLFGFPRAIQGSRKHLEEVERPPSATDDKPPLSLKHYFLDFFKAVLKFLVNAELMFLCLAATAEILIISGTGAFTFKYLAEEYDMAFDVAGYLIGGLILFSATGMLLGGVLIRVLNLDGVGMERLCVVMCVATSLLGCALLAKCPNVHLAGLEVPYPGESSVGGYTASCQGSCDCSGLIYSPVCGGDNVVYYTPCHAGCLLQPTPGPSATYSNCSCVAASLNISVDDIMAKAQAGRCVTDCTSVYILAPFLFVMLTAVLITTTPTSMATLRCVDPQLKSFALGFQWTVMRLLGSIPGPVLVGYVLDSSCEVWSPMSADGTRFCMLYNKQGMSTGVFTWWICVNLIGALFFFLASLVHSFKHKSVDLKS